jgi:hypothetical protein
MSEAAAIPRTPLRRHVARPPRLNSGTVARRSVRVKVVRQLLLAGTAVVLVAFAGSVIWRSSQPTIAIEQAKIEGDNLVIENPRFTGRTEAGERINITANRALRQAGNPNSPIRLELPNLVTDDGSKATARTGLWDPAAERLVMDEDVVFTLDSGDVARSKSAVWEPERTADGTASSASTILMTGGVTVDRDQGDRITSTAATWHDGRRTMAFDGGEGRVLLSRQDGQSAIAGDAVWDQGRQILSMTNGVRLTLLEGTVESQDATVFYIRRTIIGTGSARLAAPVGIATAERYEYNLPTGRLQLIGRVRGQLN